MRSNAISGSTIVAAAHAGVPAILTESGAQGQWSPEAVALHTNGLHRLMRHLGMLNDAALEPLPITLLEQFIWLRSEHTGFWYPDAAVDQLVQPGQNLGRVTDYQGSVLQSVQSSVAGRILFLVSSLAINQGDPLLAIGA